MKAWVERDRIGMGPKRGSGREEVKKNCENGEGWKIGKLESLERFLSSGIGNESKSRNGVS